MSANVNITTNGTRSLSTSCFSNTIAGIVGKTIAYCLILVVSLAGNIFIGITVYKTKTMRNTINFLIVNMAISDLMFPIFLIPHKLTELYVGTWLLSGHLGQALCKLVYFLKFVSSSVSTQTLVLIAVDRFGAVVFPLRSPLISSKLCPFFIIATWIVTMAIWSPWLFAFKLVEYPGRLACGTRWNKVFGENLSLANYVLAIVFLFFYTPLVMIAILYTIIYVKLKTRTIPGEQSANARQQRVKREQNVLKMAIAIVLGFAVCWLPLSIRLIPNFFLLDKQSCGFKYFWIFASFMARANCAVNPCICLAFSGNYRQSLRNLLRCV